MDHNFPIRAGSNSQPPNVTSNIQLHPGPDLLMPNPVGNQGSRSSDSTSAAANETPPYSEDIVASGSEWLSASDDDYGYESEGTDYSDGNDYDDPNYQSEDPDALPSVGEMIVAEFGHDEGFASEEDQDMFDDGLYESSDDSDESDLNSETISNCDPVYDSEEASGYGTQNPGSDLNQASSSVSNEYVEAEDDSSEDDYGEGPSMTRAGTQNSEPPNLVDSVNVESLSPDTVTDRPKTIRELEHVDLHLRRQGKELRQRRLSATEIEMQIIDLQKQLLEARDKVQEVEGSLIAAEQAKEIDLQTAGLTSALWEAYQHFCESLFPRFGLREGFSITCDEPHNNSYIDYDPKFQIFKDAVEIDYNSCNFRCEAIIVPRRTWSLGEWHTDSGNVVEFFPVRPIEQVPGEEVDTWEELFPELYSLAIEAARSGSAAAMEILVNLPHQQSPLLGWLFEYEFDDMEKDNPIISRRWKFKSAHRIDKPIELEEKEMLIKYFFDRGQ